MTLGIFRHFEHFLSLKTLIKNLFNFGTFIKHFKMKKKLESLSIRLQEVMANSHKRSLLGGHPQAILQREAHGGGYRRKKYTY